MVLINDILERIEKHINSKSDAAIARALGIKNKNSSAYVGNWRKRGTIPWEELCNFAIKEHLSFDWLLNGEERKSNYAHNWSEEAKQSCKIVREIIDTGDAEDKESILIAIRQTYKLLQSKKGKPTGRPSDGTKKLAGKKRVM